MGFIALKKSSLDVTDYLYGRLVKLLRLVPAQILVALVLIERLSEEKTSFGDHHHAHKGPKEEKGLSSADDQHDALPKVRLLTSWTGHRLLLVAALTASKMYQDENYDMQYWATVGGVDTQELYRLEVSFLKLLRWRCTVSEHEYLRMVEATGLKASSECAKFLPVAP